MKVWCYILSGERKQITLCNTALSSVSREGVLHLCDFPKHSSLARWHILRWGGGVKDHFLWKLLWASVSTLEALHTKGLLSSQLLIQTLNGPGQFCYLISYPFYTSFSLLVSYHFSLLSLTRSACMYWASTLCSACPVDARADSIVYLSSSLHLSLVCFICTSARKKKKKIP